MKEIKQNITSKICSDVDFEEMAVEIINKKNNNITRILNEISDNSKIDENIKSQMYENIMNYVSDINKELKSSIKDIFISGIEETIKTLKLYEKEMKKKINERIKDNLFDYEEIYYVRREISEYLTSLYTTEYSLKIQDDIFEFEDYVEKLLNKELKKRFKKYERAKDEDSDLQNCLAYYIGVKKGIEFNKINNTNYSNINHCSG